MVESASQQTTTSAPPPFAIPVSTQRLILFLTIILLRIIMDYSYVTYLSPEEVVENNFSNFLNVAKMWESWALMLACAAFLPTHVRKPSDFLLHIFFLFPFVATLSFFAILDDSRVYAYTAALAFVVVATTRNLKFTAPNIQIRSGKDWAIVGSILLIVTVAFAYFSILGTGKFQLNLMDVYSVRHQISQELSNNKLIGYVGTWTWTVITTFLIALSLRHKRWFLLIILLGVQLYFFGMTSAKAVLFFPVLVVLAYLFSQMKGRLAWLPASVILLVVIGIAETMTIGTHLWNHVLVRRVLWDAARLNWSYFELFSKIGHVYMSDSVLKNIIGYPFDMAPQYMVGLFAYGRRAANADTGFLGTSYMHFGPLGMIAFAFIVGSLMRITDVLTHGRIPVWMSTAIVIGPFYGLFNDSDLTTTMLTHGLALALLMLFVYGHFSDAKLAFMNRRFLPQSDP